MNDSIFEASVALIIPALNEVESISAVVRSMRNYGQVIVVDDGSSDETGIFAARAGATVVTHQTNKGYGQALTTGLQYVLDRGFEFAITVDADGQHNPEAIAQVLRSLHSGADVVVGIRDRRQRFSESIFSFVANSLWGIQDPLCGLKGYVVRRLAGLPALSTYESVGTELALIAARSGWMIAQIPIFALRRAGVSRFGSGLRANGTILRALVLGLLKSAKV